MNPKVKQVLDKAVAGSRLTPDEGLTLFECLDLASGGNAEGLLPDEIRAICSAFDVRQGFF